MKEEENDEGYEEEEVAVVEARHEGEGIEARYEEEEGGIG